MSEDEEPPHQGLPLELDQELAEAITGEIYAIFKRRELDTAQALGVLGFTVAYVMKTRLGPDPELYKHNMAEFIRIVTDIFQQLVINEDQSEEAKKTVN